MEQTPSERSNPRVTAIAGRKMAEMICMSAFVERKDGRKNPADFISGVEIANSNLQYILW